MSIERMLKVEHEVLDQPFCLPELSMLACLMFVSKTPTELAKRHLLAFYSHLEALISRERRDYVQVSNVTTNGDHDELWMCTTCSELLINSIVWCTLTDEAYCLSCYAKLGLRKRGTSKRTRGCEDFAISFRFEHPDVLWNLLNASRGFVSPLAPPPLTPVIAPAPPPAVAPPSVAGPVHVEITVPASPPTAAIPLSSLSPSDILERLSEFISVRRQDSTHELCQASLQVENDLTLSKLQREQILCANHDYPLFCHSKDVAKSCPLVLSDSKRELTYEEEFRRKYRCSIVVKGGKCGKTGTWTRPLHTCAGGDHDRERFSFHLDCAGYNNVSVPFGTGLLCLDCLKSKRQELSVAAYRSLHVWETLTAEAELYQQGYRCVEIPQDGLCFFTVLYMLAEKCVPIFVYFFSRAARISNLPSPTQVVSWLLDKPLSLLLSEVHERKEGDLLRAAEAEILQWPTRSLEAWRTKWDSEHFDAICDALPLILRQVDVLQSDYFRYCYDSSSRRGKWFDVANGPTSKPDTRFAVLFTLTPIGHYTLLEKIDSVRDLVPLETH